MNKGNIKKFTDELRQAHATIIRELVNMHPEVDYFTHRQSADEIIHKALSQCAHDLTHQCSPACYDNEDSPCLRNDPWHQIEDILKKGSMLRARPKKKEHVISSMHPWDKR